MKLKKYTFNTNEHYPSSRRRWWQRIPRLVFGAKEIVVTVRLTEASRYVVPRRSHIPAVYEQISKLIGFGHVQRIGWRVQEDGTVELFYYKGSKRTGGWLAYPIYSSRNLPMVQQYTLPVPQNTFHRLVTWINFPYFGGSIPAPDALSVEVGYEVKR